MAKVVVCGAYAEVLAPVPTHLLDAGEDHVVETQLERYQEVFGGDEVEVYHLSLDAGVCCLLLTPP